MTPQEALDTLTGYIDELESSIPEHIWDEWRHYAEEHGDEEFEGPDWQGARDVLQEFIDTTRKV